MSAKKNFWLNLGLVACGIFFAFVAIEVLGFFIPRNFGSGREINVDNEEFQYTAHLNSEKFRDEAFLKEKKPGVKRIFLIGDSFVFGSGVSDEHTLDKYLEWELKAAGYGEVEVWNLGLPDGNTRHYYQTARLFRKFLPDLVIVSLYVDNDIQQSGDGYWRSSTLDRIFANVGNFFKNLAYERGWAKCRSYWNLEYDLNNRYQKLACEGKINPALISRFAVGPNQKYYDLLTERFREDPFTGKYLLKIRELFGDVPFLLLIFPSKYQVSTRDFSLLRELGFPQGEKDLTSRGLQEAILAWAAENGVAAVDPLPVLRNASDQGLYHPIDDHPTRTGNRVVARILAEKILSLPPRP